MQKKCQNPQEMLIIKANFLNTVQNDDGKMGLQSVLLSSKIKKAISL